MSCCLVALAFSALPYFTSLALHIPLPREISVPHPVTPGLHQGQSNRSENVIAHLGSDHECDCDRGSDKDIQLPLTSDCETAINGLPIPPSHDLNTFHRLGEDDGFQLPYTRIEGTCKVSIELKAGIEQEHESWGAIREEATALLTICRNKDSDLTGGRTTQGAQSGIIIHLASSFNSTPLEPPHAEPNKPQPHADPPQNPILFPRAFLPALLLPHPNLTTIPVTNLGGPIPPAPTPILKCKHHPPPFQPDRRAPQLECMVAIHSLPTKLGRGYFHARHPLDEYELPVRRTYGSCVVEVDLRPNVEGLQGKWLDVMAEAEKLAEFCTEGKKWVGKKGAQVTGGKVSAGVGEGLIIRIGSNRLGGGWEDEEE